ncbi:MAG: ATP-binding protein, partial [Kibdelosporangium sp.]
MAGVELFGRHDELARICEFLDEVRRGGGVRLIRGDPGVGKSALMAAAAELASASGMRPLRASGSEFEAHVSYSCLNQLLLPAHATLDLLPPGPREALTVALGFGAGAPPDVLLVCNAALLLVTRLAADEPVVLVVDDVHWIDPASRDVLRYVASNLRRIPILLVVA